MIEEVNKEKTNYTTEFMSDSYDIIVSKNFKFPIDMYKKERIQLLTQFIKYWEMPGVEDYTKCAKLKLKLENLIKNKKHRKK